MTSSVKGMGDLKQFLASLPDNLGQNILRGALRAGAQAYADGARENCRDPEVRAAIKVSARSEPGIVSAKVKVQGPGAYKGPWLENGTDPHFISVDEDHSGGRTVRRINRLDKAARLAGKEGPGASLVINGQFVGTTVHHPGAKPFPFMRPAADTKGPDAIAAIGNYITTRLTKEGLAGPAEDQQDADE